MFKLAFVVVALVSVSACASLDLRQTGPALLTHESFDAAPVEPAMIVTIALHRRAFSPPSQRQPELRDVAVTAIERLRRRALRKRRVVRA
ncbi:MAG: hypothetical protein KF779_12555 [Hyphomonadaceae bacterium]|nr:hypothetical protein [Hyphomonadaceae bacterium]